MSFLSNFFDRIKDLFNFPISVTLSDFQIKKLNLEFHMFYDINKDGTVEWKDLDLARQNICKLNGWKMGTEKHTQLYELFKELWRNLQDEGDENFDGKITKDEWVQSWMSANKLELNPDKTEFIVFGSKVQHDKLEAYIPIDILGSQLCPTDKAHMWTGILKDTKLYERKKRKQQNNKKSEDEDEAEDVREEGSHIPLWFEKYMVYKFNLYDRAGDGYIDSEEFEYVLSSGFDVPPKDCRAAFTIFSQNNQKRVDMEYFRELALQYYLSDDPGALGNFINGKLSFDD